MRKERLRKISEEIKRSVSNTLMFEMKDPRLPKVISVTKVETSRDLSRANIYVSAFNLLDDEREELIKILNKAKGLFRREIGKVLTSYSTPEPFFLYDDSIEKGLEMDKLLESLKHGSNWSNYKCYKWKW